MLFLSHFKSCLDRVARAPASRRPEGVALPARSKFALTCGFIVAASGAALIGPHLGSVLAGDDHASFWRAENARKAAQRAAAAHGAPAAKGFRREEAPRGMSAYAPVAHAPAASRPFWPFLAPRAPEAERPQLEARPRSAARTDIGPRRPATSRLVCVRLCDGYFFPAPLGANGSDSGCAAACPSAPTRLYSMRSDRIADAVSVRNGAPYARLPVALHYTRVREQACSCGAPDPRTAIMSDATLRRGDRFMTENGFLIYQGGADARGSRKSFAPLAHARGLSRSERGLLMAMERASLPRPAERLAAAPAARGHAALGPPSAAVIVLR